MSVVTGDTRSVSTATTSSESDDYCGRRRDDRKCRRLNSELLTAVQNGNEHEVVRCLDEGASENATCCPSQTTALHLATLCGYSNIVWLLLSKGANVQKRDCAGRQAIHLAAAAGYDVILSMLLQVDRYLVDSQIYTENNDCPSDSDNYGDSWNHDHHSVTAKLPELSAGSTPLHLAAQRVHYKSVDVLLTHNANITIADNRGLTPLDVSGEITPFSPTPHDITHQTPSSVFSGGSKQSNRTSDNSDVENRFGDREKETVTLSPTSPHDSPTTSFRRLVGKKSSILNVVNALINKGATMQKSKVIVEHGKVVKQVKMPVTCLHTAVASGDIELIQYLLHNGACILTWNQSGETPLHLAVTKRFMEPLRILFEWDKSAAIVNARDSQGRTPLHLAVTEEWPDGVSLLLEIGADVTAVSNDKQTILHVAAMKNDSRLLEELLSLPESVKIINSTNTQAESPLCCAVSAGQTACVDLLLRCGANATHTLPGEVTLLHVAATHGHRDILKILLTDQTVSDTLKDNRSAQAKGGMTPLHVACFMGYIECTTILLDAGCDLYARTTDTPYFGATPLHLASAAGHVDVVDYILRHDERTLRTKNSDNWYPLHVAARFAHKDCVAVMLKHGANLAATIVDSSGYKKTALDIIAYSILDPASFLDEVFDCFIQVNAYPMNNPKYEIKVTYDVLTPLGQERKQLRVLDALLNCSKPGLQQTLLTHPLVETFLFIKWMRLRMFFYLTIALYFTFTLSLTVMALITYVVNAGETVGPPTITSCRVITLVAVAVIIILLSSHGPYEKEGEAMDTSRVHYFTSENDRFNHYHMMKWELIHASRLRRYYLTDLESWVKWSAFVSAAVVVTNNHTVWWLRHVTSVAVLLAWLELLFLMSRSPSAIGFYVLMFFTVANKVVRVLGTFIFVILGFTFAFMIHFQRNSPFSTVWEALVKVIVMTTEYEYTEMFRPFPGDTPDSIVGRSIFLVFVILVAIVLMNLLVGLAVSDITTLEAEGRIQRLAKQIDFLSQLEMYVYNNKILAILPRKIKQTVKRQRSVPSSVSIEPGRPSQGVYHTFRYQLRQSIVGRIVTQRKIEDEINLIDLNGKLDHLTKITEKLPQKQGLVSNKSSVCDTHTETVLERILAELVMVKCEVEKLKETKKPVQHTSYSLYPGSKLYRDIAP